MEILVKFNIHVQNILLLHLILIKKVVTSYTKIQGRINFALFKGHVQNGVLNKYEYNPIINNKLIIVVANYKKL